MMNDLIRINYFLLTVEKHMEKEIVLWRVNDNSFNWFLEF